MTERRFLLKEVFEDKDLSIEWANAIPYEELERRIKNMVSYYFGNAEYAIDVLIYGDEVT